MNQFSLAKGDQSNESNIYPICRADASAPRYIGKRIQGLGLDHLTFGCFLNLQICRKRVIPTIMISISINFFMAEMGYLLIGHAEVSTTCRLPLWTILQCMMYDAARGDGSLLPRLPALWAIFVKSGKNKQQMQCLCFCLGARSC